MIIQPSQISFSNYTDKRCGSLTTINQKKEETADMIYLALITDLHNNTQQNKSLVSYLYQQLYVADGTECAQIKQEQWFSLLITFLL